MSDQGDRLIHVEIGETTASLTKKWIGLGQDWRPFGEPRAYDQAFIDSCSALFGDNQWIHVDPKRAAAELPQGKTIVPGVGLFGDLISRMREVCERNIDVPGGSIVMVKQVTAAFGKAVCVGTPVQVIWRPLITGVLPIKVTDVRVVLPAEAKLVFGEGGMKSTALTIEVSATILRGR